MAMKKKNMMKSSKIPRESLQKGNVGHTDSSIVSGKY